MFLAQHWCGTVFLLLSMQQPLQYQPLFVLPPCPSSLLGTLFLNSATVLFSCFDGACLGLLLYNEGVTTCQSANVGMLCRGPYDA